MRRLEFCTIEPSFAHVSCYKCVAAHDFGNLFRLQLLAHLAVNRIDQRRWPDNGTTRIDAAGLHAIVVDLREHARAVIMNRARHVPVMGNDMGVEAMYE